MLWRRPLRPRPRLNGFNPPPLVSAQRFDPLIPISCRPAAAGPRRRPSTAPVLLSAPRYSSTIHGTSQVADPWFAEQCGEFPPAPDHHEVSRADETLTPPETPLEHLLQAVQRRDAPRAYKCFLNWADSFLPGEEGTNEMNADALDELADISQPTFSEILRWIDPTAHPCHDIAYGLTISPGATQFTSLGRLVDEYGVRKQHKELLSAVKIVVQARFETGRILVVPDYDVLLRCAGAAGDIRAAVEFFGQISSSGLGPQRNTRTWVEFIKARFMIDPMYYQWDRSRIALLPRLAPNRYAYSGTMTAVRLLDGLRFSLNALTQEPTNRIPGRLSKDMRIRFRARGGPESYRRHWTRSKFYGVLLNEEFLCATMIAFARSASLASIKGIVLNRGFWIHLTEDRETGEVFVRGGKKFRPGSPRQPSVRLLDAIVEAFGSMALIPAALKLLTHVSDVYEIPIPDKTWSNLLNWTYISASKPYKTFRKLKGDHGNSRIDADHVLEIWNIMTSPPYNVKPTLDDISCYVKALITKRRLRDAITAIRTQALPLYRALEDDHRALVAQDILRGLAQPSLERLQAEARKEHAWFTLSTFFHHILQSSSSNAYARAGAFTTTTLPDLLLEFADFLPPTLRYRTAQGSVTLRRPDAWRRFVWTTELRETLPADYSSWMVKTRQKRAGLKGRKPDEWPQVAPMKVLRSRRRPLMRVRAQGVPPEAGDVKARAWWRRLEGEMMT